MKELGKILQQKRESLGLDLDKVHRATKIQEKYLVAIEDGDESVFTAEIYYKSFVKSYSKFLGLSGEELLAQYEKRKCEKEEAENEQTDKNGKKCKKNKSAGEKNNDLKKLFVTVLIAGVLFAAFLYMNKHIPILDSSDRVSALEQKKERLRQLQQEQEQKEKEAREARERRMQEVTAAEQKSKVDEAGKDLKPFPQQQNTVSGQTQSAAQGAASAARQQQRQELVIDAVENVWIRVEGDGREVFQGTIVKGTKKTWKANEEFIVKIGYTPGVDVFFNGTEVDVDKDAVQDVNTLVLRRQQ